MLVTSITETGLSTLNLPDKVNGRFWIKDSSDVTANNLVSVEAVNEDWILKSNKRYAVIGKDKEPVRNVKLKPLQVYILRDLNRKKDIIIFTESVTPDRQIYKKYIFDGDIQLTIGRTNDNDIQFKNQAVSSHHAYITCKNNQWSVTDNNSTNGTFVNNKRITQDKLQIGDVVYIMGLKIIVSKNLIALNNPDGKVTVSKKLLDFIPQKIDNDDNLGEDDEEALIQYFFRSPRFKRDIETAEIKIDSPPNSPMTEEAPAVLVLGTSMTMGMMSVATLISAAVAFNPMSLIMGGSMLIGTVLFPVISKKYESNSKFKKEQLRQKKYHEYLDKMAVEIEETGQAQKEILQENILTLRECEDRIIDIKRTLWERAFGQNDFLQVRVGRGDVELDANLSFDEKKFTLDDDNLLEELYMLCDKQHKLKDVPITYSLFEDFISGVIGDRSNLINFAKGIIFQLAALYSYDEVKFVFFYDVEDEKQMGFAKWLPHAWSNDNKFRFIATNTDEAREVSAYLDKVIESRLDSHSSEESENLPYFVVFSLSKELAKKAEFLKTVYSKKDNINFSVVAFYEHLRQLPKECSMITELDEKQGKLYKKDDISGDSATFTPDLILHNNPYHLSKQLSNIYLDSENENYQLPALITFMELYQAGKVDHLNVLDRWKGNDPTQSIAAPVGVDTYGDIFTLDIHEKFHGPHGLIAGMTGSGKSEFIITYILSLAINYHPNEVAFVLIDYKGGGMAKSFENLPHTVGIITNLDGAAIKRSLVSIESELKRRQAIFASASKKVNVSNIDIYKYQKLYREGQVDEPLPHLLIISDEFAELKTQQPEFMTQLVSAARIGRSLGVHLILATQKPSGVVDDQIWSNSRFRVCLKVQERADSQDMLKRPDAAELVETGRFYLQVGYNELFELGQSAWSGAPYYPTDTVIKEKDESIQIIDTNAQVIKDVRVDRKSNTITNPNKQVDEITEYLRTTADEEGIETRLLWLEPIKPIIILDEVKEKYNVKPDKFLLNPLVGEYDDPAKQRQCPLFVPLSDEGNVILYGSAGSGKTTFINALVYSLITQYTPDEVNLYLLDFASETLRAFNNAPHVGDVALSQESEKIENLLKMLKEECATRKKLFSDYGGDYQSYIKRAEEKLPSIVVIINNYAAFSELYEDKEDDITYLAREGSKYGIYFLITAASWNGVRFRLSQNFNQLYCLQLNDESDYSSIVGRTEGLYPSKYKGRGLVKLDQLYEFQAATISDTSDLFDYIQDVCNKLDEAWDGKPAKKVPLLPDVVDIDFLSQNIENPNKLKVPIGVETKSLLVNNYNFETNYINFIYSQSDEYDNFINEFANLVANNFRIGGWLINTSFENKDKKQFKISSSVKEHENLVNEIFDTVLYRNNTYKTAQQEGKKPEKFDKKVVFINSLSSLFSFLSAETKEKLSLVLEKGSTNYNVFIIVADQINNISNFSYESWYKTNVSAMDGIWIGSGIAEQYQLKINQTTREMREYISPKFGYSVVKGNATKIKVLDSRGE